MIQIRLARNIRLGIENLLLHKLRSSLTMLGVVFGVGSVVAMLAVGEGASKEALEQIRSLGSNNVMINSIKSIEEEQRRIDVVLQGFFQRAVDLRRGQRVDHVDGTRKANRDSLLTRRVSQCGQLLSRLNG